MLVVDTNVIANLFLPSKESEVARHWLATDSEWHVPSLWRSEFMNILALYIRKEMLTLEQAIAIQHHAEIRFAGLEFHPASEHVLRLAAESGCTAYDCEFIATAEALDCTLLTADRPLLRAFPTKTTAFA
jgi:predicted nucleic acid-binding protein